MPNRLYVTKDGSGYFLFNLEPVYEDGIFIAAASGKPGSYLFQLTEAMVPLLGINDMKMGEVWKLDVEADLHTKVAVDDA